MPRVDTVSHRRVPANTSPEADATGLLKLLLPVRGQLILAVAAQALASVVGFFPLVVIHRLAVQLLAPGRVVGTIPANGIAAMLVVSLAVMLLALTIAALVSHLADNRLGLAIRRTLVEHLGTVPLGWFQDHNAGLVRKAVQDDVRALHQLVGHGVLDLTAALTVPSIGLLYLLSIDKTMTVVTLVPMLVGFIAFMWMMRGASEFYPAYDRSLAALGAAMIEFVNGIPVIKVFGRLGKGHARFARAADDFCEFCDRWTRGNARATAVFEITISSPLTLAWVLGVGSIFILQGGMAPVDILPFVLVSLSLTAPILRLLYGMEHLRVATKAAQRLADLLCVPSLPQASARPGGFDPDTMRAACVTWRDVSFAYKAGETVLHDIDLRLDPGTITALVGRSGAGKSTLASLLPRFADVDRGAITINGVDIRAIPPSDLYRLIGFVFQEAALLRMSVRDVIRLGRPDATDDEVIAAARAARIHDQIASRTAGYDAVPGGDSGFSGGEIQRICIARALLADTPILVLDEATAQADPDCEADIQDALSRLAAGRTVLVIAHRLRTIVEVDQIVVLDDGRIVERGRHGDLLARDGLYAHLWKEEQGSRSDVEIAK